MWTENQVKNKLKNVGFFAKISDNFIQVFYSGRVNNFKTMQNSSIIYREIFEKI